MDAREYNRMSVGHEGSAQSSGGTGARLVTDIHAGFCLHAGCPLQHGRFQHFHIGRRSALLRAEEPNGTGGTS